MFISFLKTKLPSAGKDTALTFLRLKKKMHDSGIFTGKDNVF